MKTTKGGKVMNPTDAYRKELRKKELKRVTFLYLYLYLCLLFSFFLFQSIVHMPEISRHKLAWIYLYLEFA